MEEVKKYYSQRMLDLCYKYEFLYFTSQQKYNNVNCEGVDVLSVSRTLFLLKNMKKKSNIEDFVSQT